MVDKDRLKDLIGGGNDDSSSNNKSKEKGRINKKKKKKKKSKNKEKTKSDKLKEFKSNTSTSSGDGGTEDVKRLLFTLANMDAYTRIVAEYEPDGFNKAHMRAKEDFAKDVSGEITNFLGVFDVRDVINEYGYDWENILRIAIENEDMRGDTLRSNSGNPTKSEVKNLLDCIANVILFVEGTYRSKKEKDNKSIKEKTIMEVSNKMYQQYRDIISTNEVQKIAEKYGFDWQEDIVEGVLTDQDFESKLN